jgi:hypothetical protein
VRTPAIEQIGQRLQFAEREGTALTILGVLAVQVNLAASTRLFMRPVVSRHGMIYRKGETLFPPQPTPQRGQWKQGSIETFDPEALRPNSLKGRQPC